MSPHPRPLPIGPHTEPAVLALNNAHEVELSWLDAERLRWLIAQTFYAKRVGEIDAFLLAFDQTAGYASPNYLWFRGRYPRFVYIDRVVVTPARRGGLRAPALCRAGSIGRTIRRAMLSGSP